MEKTSIFGVKINEDFHYVGKTKRKLIKSHVQRTNEELNEVCFNRKNDNVEIVLIKEVDENWYDEKLSEVVKKYNENHPLKNAQWMLEGKRGAWSGKKRDAHTLQRLSESKYKKICQYDINGSFVKTWKSYKDAAITVFKDYEIINGSANSRLYQIIKSRTIESRLFHNSYWFKEEELLKHFNCIPKKINITYILNEQKKRIRKAKARKKDPKYTTRRTVIHYNDDLTIKTTYDNVFHAAYMLKTTPRKIRVMCKQKNPAITLKYGKKTLQPFVVEYPEYKIEPISRNPKIKYNTRTYIEVLELDENDNIINTFDNVKLAEDFYGLKESKIRYIIYNNLNNPKLRYGEKKQYKYEAK